MDRGTERDEENVKAVMGRENRKKEGRIGTPDEEGEDNDAPH